MCCHLVEEFLINPPVTLVTVRITDNIKIAERSCIFLQKVKEKPSEWLKTVWPRLLWITMI